jgi:hypothetical protein
MGGIFSTSGKFISGLSEGHDVLKKNLTQIWNQREKLHVEYINKKTDKQVFILSKTTETSSKKDKVF